MSRFINYLLLVSLGSIWLFGTIVFVDFNTEISFYNEFNRAAGKLAVLVDSIKWLDEARVKWDPPAAPPPPALISNLSPEPVFESASLWSIFKPDLASAQTSYALTIIKNGTGDGIIIDSINFPKAFCDIYCDQVSASYPVGAGATFGVIPDPDSALVAYSGCSNVSTTVEPPTCSVKMDAAKIVYVTFNAKEENILTIKKGGTGQGAMVSVRLGWQGLNLGTEFITQPTWQEITRVYNQPVSAVISAAPATGSAFDGWVGCDSVSGGQCIANVNTDKTITAVFSSDPPVVAPSTNKLTFSRLGNGSMGFCKFNCSGGSMIVGSGTGLTISGVRGFFAVTNLPSWSGCDSVSSSGCSVTLNTDKNVVVKFLSTIYSLAVDKFGAGRGIVSGPSGLAGTAMNCGPDCSRASAIYSLDSNIGLTAAPDGNSTFGGWSGACSGTGSCAVTMDNFKFVTAKFSLPQYSLTINKSGIGKGAVSGTVTVGTGPDVSCGLTCAAVSQQYEQDTQITLTAKSEPGSELSAPGWSCSGDTCARIVKITGNQVVDAVFQLKKYTLTIYKPKLIGTRVTSDIGNINCFSDSCSEASVVLDYGSIVKLTAAAGLYPYPGIKFSAWSGDCSGAENPCSVTIDSNKAVYVNFEDVMRIEADFESVEGGQGYVVTGGIASPGIWGGITQYSWYLNGFLDESRYGVNSSAYELSIYCRPESISYEDCYHDYNIGDTVMLAALPYAGSEFVGWSNCEKTGIYKMAWGDVPACAVTDPRLVKASFAPKPSLKSANMWLDVDKAGSIGKGIVTNKTQLLGIADDSRLSPPCGFGDYPCSGWDAVDLRSGAVGDYFGGLSGNPELYLAVKESAGLSTLKLTGATTDNPTPNWRGFYLDKNLPSASLREVFDGLPLDYAVTLYAEPSPEDGSILDQWKGCNYADQSFNPPACVVYPADQNLAYREALPSWDPDYPEEAIINAGGANIGTGCDEITGGYMAGKNCYFDGMVYKCETYYYVGSKSECDNFYGGCFNGKTVACPYSIGGNCILQFSASNICVIDAYATKKVSAVFKYPKRQLTIVNTGSGQGLVTGGNYGEIFCGLDCQEKFNHDAVVTLIAKPAEGSALLRSFGDGWTCADSKSVIIPGFGTTNYCLSYSQTVKMNADKTIKVYFNRAVLTTTKDGTGTGRVAHYSKTHYGYNDGTGGYLTVLNPEFSAGGLLVPPDIDCGPDCFEDYKGIVKGVTLRAIPDDDSYFAGWSGHIQSAQVGSLGDLNVLVNDAKTVNATFKLKPVLYVDKIGEGAAQGAVIADLAPTGGRIIDCGSTCSHYASIETNIALTATAPPTYAVTWTGCVPYASNPRACNLLMPSDNHTVTVTFTPPNVKTLTVIKEGTGNGTVSSSPAGIDCGVLCSAGFVQNISVTLTAAPINNSIIAWSEPGCSGTTCAVTITDSKTVTVTFTLPLLPACALTADPPTVIGANSYDLIWTTANNPTSATIDNGIGAVDPLGGSKTISAPATTVPETRTYTMTVSNLIGNNTCSVTVIVEPPPAETPPVTPPSKFIWDKIKEIIPF